MAARARVLRLLVAVRLVNAWSLATFFQPDEYFQALEPAWRLAFGPDSAAWLTWEWHHQLRSSLHPALFAAAYLVADGAARLLPAGSALRAAVVMAAPRTLQAAVAALGDWYAWRLAVAVYATDTTASLAALLLQVCSPWQWYVSTRTFSNSLETTFTIAALYYWPWPLLGPPAAAKGKAAPAAAPLGLWRLRASLCLAALAVILRPTNILIWAPVAATTMARVACAPPRAAGWALCRETLLCGALVLGLSLASDRLYFGRWTFPPYNWLYFNLSQSLAVFYGRNPWHYYLVQGLPLLCTTALPFALVGLVRSFALVGLVGPSAAAPRQRRTLRALACAVVVSVAALSLVSHKEVRFLYPLLPLLNVLAAPHAASFFTATRPSKPRALGRPRLRRTPLLAAALAANALVAGYLGLVHQRAPLAALSFLRAEYERIHPAAARRGAAAAAAAPPAELFALFLMPCHSTPWRSHLVYPGLRAYALACEPPLHAPPASPQRAAYRDEADRFYDDAAAFLAAELFAPGRATAAPRYLVAFEGVEPWLRAFLATPRGASLGMRLARVWSGYNGLASDDWRRAGRIVVWDTGLHPAA